MDFVHTIFNRGRKLPYIITFLEGIVTFISPCLLPMLPVFLSYFAGGIETEADNKTSRTLVRVLAFILGFTVVFMLLGAFAGILGGLLRRHETIVNIVAGSVVILIGLNYIGVLKIRFLNMTSKRISGTGSISGVLSAFVFGVVFSLVWTPCVGAFLASALMLASVKGSAIQGMLMLLCFSLGLGVPFLISAVLIDKLKTAFTWIKKNYKIINIISGLFLIIIGILMMTGMMNRFLVLMTF